eukprot:1102697-Rhodomonas_salina.1
MAYRMAGQGLVCRERVEGAQPGVGPAIRLHCEIKCKKTQPQYKLYQECVFFSLISGCMRPIRDARYRHTRTTSTGMRSSRALPTRPIRAARFWHTLRAYAPDMRRVVLTLAPGTGKRYVPMRSRTRRVAGPSGDPRVPERGAKPRGGGDGGGGGGVEGRRRGEERGGGGGRKKGRRRVWREEEARKGEGAWSGSGGREGERGREREQKRVECRVHTVSGTRRGHTVSVCTLRVECTRFLAAHRRGHTVSVCTLIVECKRFLAAHCRVQTVSVCTLSSAHGFCLHTVECTRFLSAH